MKKILCLIFSIVILTSCNENVIGDFDPIEQNFSTEKVMNKRGVAYTNRAQRWSHKTSEQGAHWMYSWGNIVREEIPENVEYVPMFWGKGSVNQENIDRITQLGEDGVVKYVLGFNEPDGASQANMTVDEAVEMWPALEEIGLPLVSPATVNPENDWMQEFMRRAEEEGLRVDYVAVHNYGGDNPLALITKLKQAYEAYGKPIWLTEFAVADWNATSPSANRYSQEDVANFMREVLPALDDIDWIFRYAWFDGQNAPLFSSGLYNEENQTTAIGDIYANHVPNLLIGPGTDTEFVPPVDEDNLILNGGFETGQLPPWIGFNNATVGPGTTEPKTGGFCGRINNNDGSLRYDLEVEPGESYTLKFHSKWRDPVPNTFSGVLRDDATNDLLFTLPEMPKTDTWEETVFEFEVPNNVTKIRIAFFKGQTSPTFPPIFMDDVSLKIIE